MSRIFDAAMPAAPARCKQTASRCSSRGNSALRVLPVSDFQPSCHPGKRVYSSTAKYSAAATLVGDKWRGAGSFSGRWYRWPPYTKNEDERAPPAQDKLHTTEKRASHCWPPAAGSVDASPRREFMTMERPQKSRSQSSTFVSTNASYCFPVGDTKETSSSASWARRSSATSCRTSPTSCRTSPTLSWSAVSLARMSRSIEPPAPPPPPPAKGEKEKR